MLTIGDTARAEFIVQSSDTAKMLSISAEDDFPEVFAPRA